MRKIFLGIMVVFIFMNCSYGFAEEVMSCLEKINKAKVVMIKPPQGTTISRLFLMDQDRAIARVTNIKEKALCFKKYDDCWKKFIRNKESPRCPEDKICGSEYQILNLKERKWEKLALEEGNDKFLNISKRYQSRDTSPSEREVINKTKPLLPQNVFPVLEHAVNVSPDLSMVVYPERNRSVTSVPFGGVVEWYRFGDDGDRRVGLKLMCVNDKESRKLPVKIDDYLDVQWAEAGNFFIFYSYEVFYLVEID